MNEPDQIYLYKIRKGTREYIAILSEDWELYRLSPGYFVNDRPCKFYRSTCFVRIKKNIEVFVWGGLNALLFFV
jgi:hypothetical protein